MNEHQHSGENIGGRRNSPLASAGGNSPVLGSPILDSGRSALDGSGPQQFGDRRAPSHAEVPHRMATRRDETRRAGEHQYEYGRGVRRPPDTQEDYNPLIVAASIGGGAVVRLAPSEAFITAPARTPLVSRQPFGAAAPVAGTRYIRA